jgi:NitT/TauT family transport system permease protein
MATTIERPPAGDRATPPTSAQPRLPWSGLVGAARNTLPPIGAFVVFVVVWQAAVGLLGVPRYLLPAPTEIVAAWVENRATLLGALTSTFMSALLGFGMSIVVGMAAALVMAQSKLLERSLYPYAIMLQTIPIVAIAPLIVIWVGAGMPAVVIIAFLISLFPIISNTTAGLTSTDHNLVSMFELYNASWWQRMVKLKLPAAVPYIMTGLRISSGLAVIGAIVGEFIAGIGGLRGGLGYVIITAANQLRMPYLFASALTSSLLGILIFIGVSLVSAHFLRHWHESAVRRDV